MLDNSRLDFKQNGGLVDYRLYDGTLLVVPSMEVVTLVVVMSIVVVAVRVVVAVPAAAV